MKMTKKDRYRIKVLEKRIADGDLDAMMEYAQRYQCNYREEVTPEIAQKIVTCYETCIEAGNLTAALNLGAMYYGGEFIPRNFRKAIRYYEQATEADDLISLAVQPEQRVPDLRVGFTGEGADDRAGVAPD